MSLGEDEATVARAGTGLFEQFPTDFRKPRRFVNARPAGELRDLSALGNGRQTTWEVSAVCVCVSTCPSSPPRPSVRVAKRANPNAANVSDIEKYF